MRYRKGVDSITSTKSEKNEFYRHFRLRRIENGRGVSSVS